MVLGEERLSSIIESLLLVSGEPVPIARIVEVIRIEDAETEVEAIESAIAKTVESYRNPERAVARGIRIEAIGPALQFRTVAENAPFVRRILAARPQKLSKATLETLAVIAYRQPATKPEVEAVRGVDVSASLKTLLDRDLVRILGKKDEIGRPIVYATTETFLELFGLRGLGELPTLREYHELDEEHQRKVDALEGSRPRVSDLAEAATFLEERLNDPDLDALDRAVIEADRVRKATGATLDPVLDGDPAEHASELPAPSIASDAAEAVSAPIPAENVAER